jgi:predicted PhzF superfamily epimerase YddE/YHI9
MSVSLTWVDAFTDALFAGNPAGVCLLDEPRPGTFGLRWFSPLVEIDLCGHATLASAHAQRASFAGDLIELDFPADTMTETPLPNALEGEWDAGVVVGAGITSFFTVVILRSEAAVREYRPDLAAIAATGSKALLLTAAADPGSGADYVLRVFGPNVGIDEDPATGSAQCVAGPYWSAVLGRSEMVARQLSPRGAVLHVRPDGERVHIGGNAVTVFTGHPC